MKTTPTKPKSFDYATRLRELRHAAGLSQIELARRAGLHWQTVLKLELAARASPSFETICKLCDALEVPLDTFRPTKPKRK
jgi:transcriptional regulator with XRE-family HTH domain